VVQDEQEWSVVVAGAGPVGMTLAAELGRRGVSVLVLEQANDTTTNPRCNTTNARSMEYFRRLGVADRIRRAGLPLDHPTDVVYCTSLTGHELTRFRFSSAAAVLDGTAPELLEWPTPEPQHRISQIFLEPILAEHLATVPGVQLRRGWRVTAVREVGDHAEVDAVGPDGQRHTIAARYVVGCDGGASVVRRGIGVAFEGDGKAAEERLSVYFRSPALTERLRGLRERPGWMYWWYGPRLRGSFLQLDGRELFLCHARVPDGERPEDLHEDEVLRAALGDDIPLDVIEVVRWTPRRLVANRFRSGRVLLAGDAAHVWLPLGGFGMNTGIADAVGLGWRLAAVVAGWGGERLLDDYAFERRSVGEATSQAALKIDLDMKQVGRDPRLDDDSPDGERLRAEAGELIQVADRQQWYSQGVQFGNRYTASAGVTGRVDVDPSEAIARIDEYSPSDESGSRFPHTWLPDGRSCFDELGRDFTLVRIGADPPDVASVVDAAARAGIPLVTTDLPGEPGRPALVLVRPDLYVAWSGDALPASPDAFLRGLLRTPVPTASAAAPTA